VQWSDTVGLITTRADDPLRPTDCENKHGKAAGLQRIHRFAGDENVELHHRRRAMACQMIIERGVPTRCRFQAVVEVHVLGAFDGNGESV
jgi:hypothetical protein